jgi:hypothetical protein
MPNINMIMNTEYVFDLGIDCSPIGIDVESLDLSGYGKNTINGIAFTSYDGKSSTGFNYSFGIMKEHNGSTYLDMQFIRKHKIRSPYSHRMPTEFFHHVEKNVNKLADMGIEIFRCRLSKLPGQGSIPLHQDSPSSRDYCVKVHIPVVTNDSARFNFGPKQYKMEAGKIYLANVAQPHQFDNPSPFDRYHIIADCIVKNKDLPLYCEKQSELISYYTEWDRLMESDEMSHRWFRQDQFGCW